MNQEIYSQLYQNIKEALLSLSIYSGPKDPVLSEIMKYMKDPENEKHIIDGIITEATNKAKADGYIISTDTVSKYLMGTEIPTSAIQIYNKTLEKDPIDELNKEIYLQLYQYIKSELLDTAIFLGPNDQVFVEVFSYMKDPENEKRIIDDIIRKGIKMTKEYCYLINLDTVSKFLTGSAITSLAKQIYQMTPVEEQNQNLH